MTELFDDVYTTDCVDLTPMEMVDDLVATAEFIQRRVDAGTYLTVPPAAKTLLGLSEQDKHELAWAIERSRFTPEDLTQYIDHLLEQSM